MISVKNNKIARAYKGVTIQSKTGEQRKIDVGFDKNGRYRQIVYNSDRTQAYFRNFVSEKYVLAHLDKQIESKRGYEGFLGSAVAKKIVEYTRPLALAASLALATGMTYITGCSPKKQKPFTTTAISDADLMKIYKPQIKVKDIRPVLAKQDKEDKLTAKKFNQETYIPPRLSQPQENKSSKSEIRFQETSKHYTNVKGLSVTRKSEYVWDEQRGMYVTKRSVDEHALVDAGKTRREARRMTEGLEYFTPTPVSKGSQTFDKEHEIYVPNERATKIELIRGGVISRTQGPNALDNLNNARESFIDGLWMIPTALTLSQIPSGKTWTANDGDFTTPIKNTGKGLTRVIGNAIGLATSPYHAIVKGFDLKLPVLPGYENRSFGKGFVAHFGGVFEGAKMSTLEGVINVGGYPDDFYGPLFAGSKKEITAGTELGKATLNGTIGFVAPKVAAAGETGIDVINHGVTLEGMTHSRPENIDSAYDQEGWLRIWIEQSLGYLLLYGSADSAINTGNNSSKPIGTGNPPGRSGGAGVGFARGGGAGGP
jgi:hypothetical protein